MVFSSFTEKTESLQRGPHLITVPSAQGGIPMILHGVLSPAHKLLRNVGPPAGKQPIRDLQRASVLFFCLS